MSLGNRIKILDGVRGLAVLSVLFHHSVWHTRAPLLNVSNSLAQLLRNGFWKLSSHYDIYSIIDGVVALIGQWGHYGVELFFTLSGFLISRILFNAAGRSTRYYRNFYIRRALRILPSYYLFAFILYLFHIIGSAHGTETQAVSFSGVLEGLSVFFFLFNFWTFFNTGPGILVAHLWSLGIEEQFYLIYPAILKHLSAKKMIFLLSIIPFACLVIRAWLASTGYSEWQIRVFAPGRADAIGFGCLLFFLMQFHEQALLKYRKQLIICFWASALAFFGIAIFAVREEAVFGYLFVSVLTFILIYLSLITDPSSLLSRFFCCTLMTAFGKYSYAIYLFHPLILECLNLIILKPLSGILCHQASLIWLATFLILSSISLVFGWTLYYLYERHFLNYKDKLCPNET